MSVQFSHLECIYKLLPRYVSDDPLLEATEFFTLDAQLSADHKKSKLRLRSTPTEEPIVRLFLRQQLFEDWS